MKILKHVIILIILLLQAGCIVEFVPNISEEKELIVVEGLLTDQGDSTIIKLSVSLPLGQKSEARPLTGCTVALSDDMGSNLVLDEVLPGTYVSHFHGYVGRTYTLHIKTGQSRNNFSYESYPVRMKPAPPIDSVYWEKRIIRVPVDVIPGIDECQIYLDTHSPDNSCRYYRWDYTETWKLRLPFDIPNYICWMTNTSKNIYIQSTAALNEDRIKHYPVTYISNATDRLKTRYSIIVNQYSLNEDEYYYWEKLKKLTEQAGGLYDIIPSSIPSNIFCVNDPGEKVLGYFSVSAKSSSRIYIQEKFAGIIDPYAKCASDTLLNGPDYIEGLGETIWTLFDTPGSWTSPRIRIFTIIRGCADCTVRGSKVKPDFWTDGK